MKNEKAINKEKKKMAILANTKEPERTRKISKTKTARKQERIQQEMKGRTK